jgi:hypothetical protein
MSARSQRFPSASQPVGAVLSNTLAQIYRCTIRVLLKHPSKHRFPTIAVLLAFGLSEYERVSVSVAFMPVLWDCM